MKTKEIMKANEIEVLKEKIQSLRVRNQDLEKVIKNQLKPYLDHSSKCRSRTWPHSWLKVFMDIKCTCKFDSMTR